MIAKLLRRSFCTQSDQQIKLNRRQVVDPQQTAVDEHSKILQKAPFYRFPYGFLRPLGCFAIPAFYNFGDLNAEYFSMQLTDGICKYHDIMTFGFAGMVGATVGCIFMSNYGQPQQEQKLHSIAILGAFSLAQLSVLLLGSMMTYQFWPSMIGPSFLCIIFQMLFVKYSSSAGFVPKTYFQANYKWNQATMISTFLILGAIMAIREHENNMNRKLKEMQQLSDQMNKDQ